MPTAASTSPIRAAVSSNATVFAVGSAVIRRCSKNPRPRSSASPLSCRTALSHEAPSNTKLEPQHDVGDRQAAQLLGVEHGLDALEDRVAGPEHEDPDRRDQRPEVALHAVAERVLRVGGLLAALERGHQEDLVEGVGERVRRLGEHRGGARDQSADELGDGDREVGRAGEEHGADGLVGARARHGPRPWPPPCRCRRRPQAGRGLRTGRPARARAALLALEPAGVAGERAVGPDHPVARDHDRDRVAAVGQADGPRRGVGLAEPVGDLAVRRGLAVPISRSCSHTCCWKSVPRGASGRSNSLRSRAKYAVSWSTASRSSGSSSSRSPSGRRSARRGTG